MAIHAFEALKSGIAKGEPQQKPTDAYSTGIMSKDLPTELARLHAVERWTDPTTMAILRALPIRPHWSCLEIGAGAGSVAYWLAKECHQGDVVAADIDARYLLGPQPPNMDVLQTDLTKYEFPKTHFDLIHARLVLSFIPQREELLRRAVEWLRPGGALVVEEAYMLDVEDCPSKPLSVAVDAFGRALAMQGANVRWARKVPSLLAKLGMTNLRVTTTPLSIGLEGAADDVWSIGFEQFRATYLERELMTDEQIAAYRALPEPERIDVPVIVISVSALRPL